MWNKANERARQARETKRRSNIIVCDGEFAVQTKPVDNVSSPEAFEVGFTVMRVVEIWGIKL